MNEFLTAHVHSYDLLPYPDHHIFNSDDLAEIKKHFNKMESANKIILTTEKDGVRLKKFKNELKDFPLYVLPIQHSFMFNEAEKFCDIITSFIGSFDQKNMVHN